MAARWWRRSPAWSGATVGERATTPREWAIAVAGGLALSAVLVWVLRGPGPDPAPVAVTAAPPPIVAAPPPIAAPAASPPPAPVMAAGNMTLRGLIVRPGAAASAIIETSDGRQRLVRAGTGLAGGMTVESIDAGGVVLAGGGGGRQRLTMPNAPAATESGPATGAVPRGALAATANDYRLGMRPRKSGGRITGYEVTDTSRLPALRLAGMLPGDVLISVNGSGVFSDEKLLEMPAEIAGAYAFDVVFERGGQQRRAVVNIAR